MEDFVGVELIEVLLLHIGRVKHLELILEQRVVSGLELFNKVKSLHLYEGCLQVGADVLAVWLQDERVQEAIGASLEVRLVVIRQAKVNDSSNVVRSQVDSQLVSSYSTVRLEELGTGSSVLVPERVVHRFLFDRRLEVKFGLGEVSLKEHEHAKREKDLHISWVLLVSHFERLFDLHEVKVAAVGVRDLLVIRVELEPLVHVVKGILLGKLISETDAEGQQAVKVVWVLFMGLSECNNRLFILV